MVGLELWCPRGCHRQIQGYSISKEVQAFVVILGYWWAFTSIPHLAQGFCPLYQLVKKGYIYIWDWGAEQLATFEKAKILVSWNLTGKVATSMGCFSKPGRHGLDIMAKTTKGMSALRVLAPTMERSRDQIHLIELPFINGWVVNMLHWPASVMARTPALTKSQTYFQQRHHWPNSTLSQRLSMWGCLNLWKNSMRIYLSQIEDIAWKQALNRLRKCSQEWQFFYSFYILGIKEGTSGRLQEGEKKQGREISLIGL